MKQLAIILTIGMLTFAAPAQAANSKVYVDVHGLVCDFCARALEKVFGRQAAVSDIDVNLNTKVITLNLKDGMQLEDGMISKLINDAGYNVVKIRHQEQADGNGSE